MQMISWGYGRGQIEQYRVGEKSVTFSNAAKYVNYVVNYHNRNPVG